MEGHPSAGEGGALRADAGCLLYIFALYLIGVLLPNSSIHVHLSGAAPTLGGLRRTPGPGGLSRAERSSPRPGTLVLLPPRDPHPPGRDLLRGRAARVTGCLERLEASASKAGANAPEDGGRGVEGARRQENKLHENRAREIGEGRARSRLPIIVMVVAVPAVRPGSPLHVGAVGPRHVHSARPPRVVRLDLELHGLPLSEAAEALGVDDSLPRRTPPRQPVRRSPRGFGARGGGGDAQGSGPGAHAREGGGSGCGGGGLEGAPGKTPALPPSPGARTRLRRRPPA